MVEEPRSGLMDRNMKVTGRITWRMAKGDLFTEMGMFMKEAGQMTKQRDLESTRILMALSTWAHGGMINRMVKARKAGLMVQCMKETTKMARNMGLEYSNGQTAQNTKVISETTTLKDLEPTFGPTTESMRESGFQTKCMEKASSRGQMADFTKANT